MRRVKKRRKDLIKNTNDKRYVETQNQLERAIGKYLKMGWLSRINTPVISNEAKVWNSTFYNHYIHMDEAIDVFFHKMEPDLRNLAKETFGQNLEIVFYKILYFIYQNREYYEVIVRKGYSQVLTKIAVIFQPVIERGWSNYGMEDEEKYFCIFSWEFCGVLYYWGCFENFDYDQIDQHTKELSRLAQNTSKRLTDCLR